MTAEQQRLNVFHRATEFHREERAESRDIEATRLAEHAMGWESRSLPRGVDHRVEWIGKNDDHSLRRELRDLFRDARDDAHVGLDEIITAHAGLARNARGDHNDFTSFDERVVASTLDVAIESLDGRGLIEIKRLALGHAVCNINEHDVAEFFGSGPHCTRCTGIAGPDDRNFCTTHVTSSSESL